MADQDVLAREAPSLDIDPFAPDYLLDPYPAHEAMRQAGPIVRLAPYGVFASARYAPVQQALQDWETFSSAAGVGLADFRKEPPWRPPSLILEADPPLHTRTRKALLQTVSAPVLSKLRAAFFAEAERMADRLAGREFDAVAELAQAYPVKVFADALGLTENGREHLLPYADLNFNAFGPRNAIFLAAQERAAAAVEWVAAQCRREALQPDGIGAALFAAADRGELTEQEAGLLVRSFLSAGLDTTVHGLANTIFCLARHPDQWAALRADPTLVRPAFEEVLRYESPVQIFFRTTTRATELEGVPIGGGEKIVLFLGAANRDPRQWDRPEVFDIRRRPTGHVAFGFGIHGCAGQMVARLETEAVLSALIPRVREIQLAGEPTRKLNNSLRGLQTLPVRFVA